MGVLNVFQSNPNISSVEFCDMALTSATVLPLFRSLQFHDQLVRLSLSGNRIGMCNYTGKAFRVVHRKLTLQYL